ncbi:hypothetical protein DFH07DRAFT_962247 [Mycena maculata]|uniref:Uncharacterized protein n=1 Tax=Mycena maculata TaxID=230809 RepID=A0AAD7IRP1_9AGAR|nr:hypothetical protein DFH07DRAFT_962247 [Mycena maculata]
MEDKCHPEFSEKPETSHVEYREHNVSRTNSRRSSHVNPALEAVTANAKLANPLHGIPREQLLRDGGLVAQDPLGSICSAFESIDILDEEDNYYLRREITRSP